jgi:transposase
MAMTCATCARRAPPNSPASGGKARPTRSTRCASPARCRPTRTCRWRSNEHRGDAGPEETHELLNLWHNQRRSLLKSRQHLLNEADALLHDLPEEIRADLPEQRSIRSRLKVLGHRERTRTWDPVTALRLRLLDDHAAAIAELDAREREASRELHRLTRRVGSTLSELCGIADRSDAELLVEAGDPRRFAGEGGFARFNGTAPLPASSAEGDNEPKRHRLNRGGNRRVNSVLHLMAVTQLRCEPRARQIYDDARRRGHTKKEAMRILKRQLSNVVYRRMIRDLNAALSTRPIQTQHAAA